MKKLLKVSLVAILAVGPVAAFADGPLVKYANGSSFDLTTKPTVTASDKIASQSYVQGAYNELAEAINTVSETAAGGQTESQVQSAIDAALSSAGGDGLAWDANGKKFNVDLAATNAGLSVDSQTGKLSADVYEVKDSSTNGNIVVNGAEVTVFDASGYQTALSTTNTLNGAYITDSTITNGKLADSTISESKLDTTLQAKIDNALTTASLNGYATEQYVDSKIANSFDSTDNSHAVTGSQVSGAISSAINSAITNDYSANDTTHAVTGSAVAGAISGALADYTTSSSLASTYATKTYVDNKRVEVVETWGSSTTSQVELVNAQ